MIYDHRTYVCRPGTIKLQMKLYEEHGLAAQTRNLGRPVFYGMVETGDVNAYIHIWAYENAADRETRRAAMAADPDWQAFIKLSAEAGYLAGQMNTILTPAPFFKQPT
ncbi:MAG: NIPSNAP family protein [Paracoccaceae bacterium]